MRHLILLVSILSIPTLCFSATIVVPDDYPTIQGAIDAAISGDTVQVDAGTYTENIDFKGKAITVKSSDGSPVTFIDGGQAGSVVSFVTKEGPDSVLDGFTITNGNSNYGGGINGGGTSFTLINNVITGNQAAYGGGLNLSGFLGTPLIENNVICFNTCSYDGGGINITSGAATIKNNQIHNNTASGGGGGIKCHEMGLPLIQNNDIFENQAASDIGGGIASNTQATPTILGNTIRQNTAQTGGGGIGCIQSFPIILCNVISENSANDGGGISGNLNALLTMKNNVIMGNVAQQNGGGVYCYNFVTMDASNNIIVNNAAGANGGGISGYKTYAVLENETISGNTAMNEGGGLYCWGAAAFTKNTIFWANAAPAGKEVFLYSAASASMLDIQHSDMEGGQASVFVGPNCSLQWGPGMIDAVPLFVDESNGDLHLTYNSPCRGSGDNLAVSELYDFEGDPRIAYGTVDMGADEFYTHLYITGDKTPGGAIQGKFVGLPGTTPVGLFVGSGVLPSPMNTMWGKYWLQTPYVLLGPLGAIPSDGVMVLPTTLPPGMTAPVDIPMQALIGLNADSLSNLCVLEVR